MYDMYIIFFFLRIKDSIQKYDCYHLKKADFDVGTIACLKTNIQKLAV